MNNLKVSRASAYRVINLFMQKGLLKMVDLGKDSALYEVAYDASHHDHIFCLRCGKIIEFEEKVIEELQKEVCKKNSFSPLRHTLRIVGLCKDCKRKKL
jgi:Fur family ferric uptake transcriptional regulator